jgi:hypothetical protein
MISKQKVGADVERQPVNHLIHGSSARGKRPAMQLGDFQMLPQAFSRRVIPAVPLAAHRVGVASQGQRVSNDSATRGQVSHVAFHRVFTLPIQ